MRASTVNFLSFNRSAGQTLITFPDDSAALISDAQKSNPLKQSPAPDNFVISVPSFAFGASTDCPNLPDGPFLVFDFSKDTIKEEYFLNAWTIPNCDEGYSVATDICKTN